MNSNEKLSTDLSVNNENNNNNNNNDNKNNSNPKIDNNNVEPNHEKTSPNNKNILNREKGNKDSNILIHSASQDVEMITQQVEVDEKLNKDNQRQTVASHGLENSSVLSGLQFQVKPETSIKRHVTLKVLPVANVINNDASKLNNKNTVASKYEAAVSLSSLNSSTDSSKCSNNNNNNNNNTNNIIKLLANNQTIPAQLIQPVELTNLNDIQNQNVCYMMHTPIDLVTTTITTTSTTAQQEQSPSGLMITRQSKRIGNHHHHHHSNASTTTTTTNLTTVPMTTTTTTTVSCLSPILSSSSSSSSLSSQPANKIIRDEKRRANHNEVEKRRRNNINKWIIELSKIIPDCNNDHSKHGQSKGGILEKSLKYLIDMRHENENLKHQLSSLEHIKRENELLKEQNTNYIKECDYLKSKLNSLLSDKNGQSNQLPSIKSLTSEIDGKSFSNNNIDVNNNLDENHASENGNTTIPQSKIDQILMIAYNKVN